MSEKWKPVIGWEGCYEVSNKGNIRNARTKLNRKLRADRYGYYRVTIWKNNKAKVVKVHSVVSEVFIGKRPEGMVVNHKDGDKSNNKPRNLEYVSTRENRCHGLKDKKNKGTQYLPRTGKWSARAKVEDRVIYIGTYENPELAAKAYRKFLKESGIRNKYA